MRWPCLLLLFSPACLASFINVLPITNQLSPHAVTHAVVPRAAAVACSLQGLDSANSAAEAQSGAVSAPVAQASPAVWERMSGIASNYEVPGFRDLHRATWYLQEHSPIIQRAAQVAASAHEGQRRKNGDPFILHPVETACILADLKMDLDTIVAALLHDTVEDTALTTADIQELFGSSVATIVEGETKQISSSDGFAPDQRRELNHRQMLLAMGADWRVVMVKLADRLHNMRTLQYMPRHKQVRIARETIEIFVPLARRIGISQLEYELLRLSVDYLFPQELIGTFGWKLLGHWARLQFWGVLDDFLLRDQVLSGLDVSEQINDHRRRWTQHRNDWGVAFAK